MGRSLTIARFPLRYVTHLRFADSGADQRKTGQKRKLEKQYQKTVSYVDRLARLAPSVWMPDPVVRRPTW